MYPIAHRKKDGSFINEDAQKKSEELEKEIGEGSSENDAFTKVFGKEHPGYVRGMGFGVCPSQVYGSSSRRPGASDAPSRAEHESLKLQHDSLKLQVQLLQEQVMFFVRQQGGQIPPGFPTNPGIDLDSPTGARPSSSASHDPQNHGPPSSHP